MTQFKSITDTDRINGTSLVGQMNISYADLVATLGAPHESDGFKVDAQWILEFPDGTVATIYNYKTGRNYLGPEGPATEEIRDWHIGGFTPEAVSRVADVFGCSSAVTVR